MVFLLIVDTVLPRSIAALRPEQWSPPIPFNNPQSYWWPADVTGRGGADHRGEPGRLRLPAAGRHGAVGADRLPCLRPARLLCTRLLAGLAGADSTAQPLVDWLRREWLTNTPPGPTSTTTCAAMPESVRDKPVILLDDGSNVIGLESVDSLLDQYSKARVQAAKDAAAQEQSGRDRHPLQPRQQVELDPLHPRGQ